MARNPDYLSVAKYILTEKFPDAACGFVAGSVTRNEGTATSDIDMVVLYSDDDHETYRETIFHDGWPIELFVHTPLSQDYFLNNDTADGSCAMAHMISSGIVIGNNIVLAQQRRKIAKDIIDAGPPPLSPAKIDFKRYALCDRLDDLQAPKDADYIPAILADLFNMLGDFYLRANGHWSGTGKQMIRLMKQADNAYCARFLSAFNSASMNDNSALEKLLDETLQPFGGRLLIGYKAVKPKDTMSL